MKRAYSGTGRPLLLILVLLVMTTYGQGNAGEAGSGIVTPSIPEMTEALTPLVLAVLTPPHPVPGADGLFHLVYELQVTNASSLRWRIESVTVQDAEKHDAVVVAYRLPLRQPSFSGHHSGEPGGWRPMAAAKLHGTSVLCCQSTAAYIWRNALPLNGND